MSTSKEHIEKIKKAMIAMEKDGHVKSADIFVKFEDVRFAVHDLEKLIEQD